MARRLTRVGRRELLVRQLMSGCRRPVDPVLVARVRRIVGEHLGMTS